VVDIPPFKLNNKRVVDRCSELMTMSILADIGARRFAGAEDRQTVKDKQI
jgi:hypothetical protein